MNKNVYPILEKIRKVFKLNEKNEIGNTWFDYDRRIIVGHFGNPNPGDVFTCKMQSGKIGVFEVTKVNWCCDPKNMYFAYVVDVGYWINNYLPKKVTFEEIIDEEGKHEAK
jgi:hypothetical protein